MQEGKLHALSHPLTKITEATQEEENKKIKLNEKERTVSDKLKPITAIIANTSKLHTLSKPARKYQHTE